jgi:hypothetical protein
MSIGHYEYILGKDLNLQNYICRKTFRTPPLYKSLYEPILGTTEKRRRKTLGNGSLKLSTSMQKQASPLMLSSHCCLSSDCSASFVAEGFQPPWCPGAVLML